MNASAWCAAAIPLQDGVIAVDVCGSGRFAQYSVNYKRSGITREFSSTEELARELVALDTDGRELAQTDPTAFAFLMCVLAGRPARVLPLDSSLWTDLERHFRLNRSANQPRIEAGQFVFLVCPQYMPVLTVNQLRVDLRTLNITEEPLIAQPWPPA